MKKKLKKYFAFPLSLSLIQKLTLYFTLFGIIIGYVSYVFFAMASTHDLFYSTYNNIKENFFKLEEFKEGDHISRLIGTKNNNSANAIRFMESFSMNNFSGIRLYYHTAGSKEWRRLVLDDSDYFRDAGISSEDHEGLEKASRYRIYSPDKFFLGTGGRIRVFMDVTRSIDRNRYAITFEADRAGILTLIKKNIINFLLFGVILVAVSFMLAKIFSKRMARPISHLANGSREIATGNFGYRFSLKSDDELGILAGSLNSMAERIEAHIREIESRMKAMETMNRIDKEVLSSTSKKDLLARVMNIVKSLFTGSSVIIALRDDEKKGYSILLPGSEGMEGFFTEPPFIKDSEFSGDMFREHNVFLAKEAMRSLPEKILELFDFVIGTMVNSPIVVGGKYLGALCITVGNSTSYSETDIESVKMLSDQVGIALHSVREYEEKEKLFLGILMALTKALDAKSKWSAGHSERVARYSVAVGRKMGLNEYDLNMLSISAILHDIGKIGIPESILDKEGILTEDEYGMMKSHPEKGAEIITEIFSYEKIVPGILYHHEFWNGRGYPFGLKEFEIPVKSRIISIADVFDAITADRPYRKGMDRDKAIAFMIDEKGRMFDPAIVDIFIGLLEEVF